MTIIYGILDSSAMLNIKGRAMLGMYKLDGKTAVPCEDTIEWAIHYEKADRHVAMDTIYGVRVSTIFLGLDYNWGGGRPLLFETMAFGGRQYFCQDRYCTWEEAEAGHNLIVKNIRRNPWKFVVLPWIQIMYWKTRYTIINWADIVKGKVSHGISRALDYLRSSFRLP